MRVGIDFRVFQVGHQFRGIGQVARQALVHLDRRLPEDARFVLFVDPDGPDVHELADELFGPSRRRELLEYPNPRYPRLAKLRGPLTPARERLLDARCDVFVQFDFMLGLPAAVPAVAVLYDQIPLLLGDVYPQHYRPHFSAARRAGMPLKQALYKGATRRIYERMLVATLNRAQSILAISEHTARTTAAFADTHGVPAVRPRIHVAHLGHGPTEPNGSDPDRSGNDRPDVMVMHTLRGLGLDRTPFVFFMGGTDDRRRIDDLVAAFNDLRARGRDLKLVLAGYDFVTPHGVLSEPTRRALLESSYRDDIHLLGYVDDTTRRWLYEHAEAFVFPSLHEGFGLPVIESLGLGCPVVAYDNTSITEVAGPNCVLVDNRWEHLATGIATLMDRDPDSKTRDTAAGRAWADRFTWDDFGATITELVVTAAY